MKLQRTFICIASVFFAVGFAASQAVAGTPGGVSGCGTVPDDDGNGFMEIEINALRAGGKTIVTGPQDTTKVTSKARIRKGTAPISETMVTVLTIEAWTDVLECVPRPEEICEQQEPPLDPDPFCLKHDPTPQDPDPLCLIEGHDPISVPLFLGGDSQPNITIAVGKGGKGASLVIDTKECGPSEFITFVAEFRGEDKEGETCVADRELRKACR